MARNIVPAITPETSLTRYLQQIRAYPMLTQDDEYMLSNRWLEHEDVDAAGQLVTSHLRLVAKIAMGYRGYGMIQAVKRFDPEKGFRLATYAMWWIRASIQEYILHSWSLVKMGTTAAQKKLFFNLRKIKGQLKAIDDGDLHPDTVTVIATKLGVAEKDVVSMNRRMAAPDGSLNAPLRVDGEGEWMDWLVDDTPDQEYMLGESQELNQRRGWMAEAMEGLNEREQHILTERRLSEEPQTLEDLSTHYGISRERVRQIEVRAFEKLQKAMRGSAMAEKLAQGDDANRLNAPG